VTRRGAGRLLLANPAAWLLLAAVVAMPYSRPAFAALFPHLKRPLYVQDGFASLLGIHAALVAASSLAAAALGVGAAVFATRAAGAAFRPMIEQAVAVGQTVPPVAVLALAVPAMGYGAAPALVALTLYGVLPVLRGALAGLDGIAPEVAEAARGMGMSGRQRLLGVELPLAAPLILAGVRVSAVVNVGTAAIASTVGVRTLGTPIIVGLDGANLAYVLQGALITGLLAVALDRLLASAARAA
jgi:osmoprotectant transport system permease protein